MNEHNMMITFDIIKLLFGVWEIRHKNIIFKSTNLKLEDMRWYQPVRERERESDFFK